MASILHDIGKISIPDNILNKPGRLTKDEFDVMKLHPVKGCEIFENMPQGMLDEDIYEYCYDICRHHHERWDGKGYPDGLCGDDISIWAQIVAIADVYDALISPRVYKSAYDHDTAVKMILNGECGTFNSKVLEAFRKSLDIIRSKDADTVSHEEEEHHE
jgi:putative two-component system response regulator